MALPRRGVIVALAVALVVAAAPGSAVAQQGKRVTLTAKLTGSAASLTGLRVLVLPTRGSSVTVVPKGGRITARIAASALNGTSLQLIRRDGSYAGPVLLNRSGTRGATRLRSSSRTTLALGAIRVSKGFAVLVKPLPTSMTLAKGRVRLAKSGKPIGANRLGLVRTATARAARQGAGAPGGPCGSDQATEAGPGGDCDLDGVPNTVDVDDNGNLTLDAVDAVSARVSARLNPWSALRPALQNAMNVYTGATRDEINRALGAVSSVETGAAGNLQLSFYIGQPYLEAQASTAFDHVWISCPAQMAWCAPATGSASPTATISGFTEAQSIVPGLPAFGATPWIGYNGSECRQGAGCTPTNGPSGNALVELYRTDAGPTNLPTWVAMLQPNSPDTLGGVVPGDVVTINAGRGGVVTQVPISLSPYFVTSPALQSANTTTFSYPLSSSSPGASEGTAIVLGADGLLELRLWRPQRFALPGETAEYYDVAGLHWGATVDFIRPAGGGGEQRPSREGGCAVSNPVGLTPAPYSSSPDDPFNAIVPLIDDTRTDFATDRANAANATIGFTIDVNRCLRDNGLTPSSGAKVAISLQGVGEPLTGGANRSGLSLSVQLP